MPDRQPDSPELVHVDASAVDELRFTVEGLDIEASLGLDGMRALREALSDAGHDVTYGWHYVPLLDLQRGLGTAAPEVLATLARLAG